MATLSADLMTAEIDIRPIQRFLPDSVSRVNASLSSPRETHLYANRRGNDMDQSERPPARFLISYAHESSDHIAAVRTLCTLLRDHDLDVVMDAFADEERQDWALWTDRQIAMAQRVLVVCSPRYRARFEATAPIDEGRGVRLEGVLIREWIARDMSAGLRRFVPVLLPGGRIEDIPTMLQPLWATYYPITELTSDGVARLVRLLRRDPAAADDTATETVNGTTGGPVAALRLSVHSGTPDGVDAAVRELMAVGGTQVVPDLNEERCSTGAVLAGQPDAVVSALTRVARRLGVLPDHRDGLLVSLGGHVATTADAAAAGAADLADGGAARRMHAVPGASLVVVVSPELHRYVAAARAPYPAVGAYREWPLDGDVGRPVLVAVPGRSMCPELPAATARSAASRTVHIGGNNIGGVVGDGNTVTYHGPVITAGRDAHVNFDGRP